MKVKDVFFGKCLLLGLSSRDDVRGSMEVYFKADDLKQAGADLVIAEQRIYRMPSKGTFFGIHYQDGPLPQSKLISLISGRGLDYIVDLRRDSPTYIQYKVIELVGGSLQAVYIPAGFGHAFLSLADNTIQLFAADAPFSAEHSRAVNYKDPSIGLRLPLDDNDIIISDKDRQAGYLE